MSFEKNEVVVIETNKISRFKSPVFWIAIVTNVLFVLKVMGVLEPLGITEDSYREIVIAITSIINAFGIANNPTDKVNW